MHLLVLLASSVSATQLQRRVPLWTTSSSSPSTGSDGRSSSAGPSAT